MSRVLKFSRNTRKKISNFEIVLLELFEKIIEVLTFRPVINYIENLIFVRKLKLRSKFEKKPKIDKKAKKWEKLNPWFGKDRLMTSLALGLHEELVEQNGQAYATTDEYYQRIDTTIRNKFPEYFEDDVKTTNGGGKPVTRTDRPATVVAPASRSTSSKKIVLKQSQLSIAKKLGLTPEQYAREFAKTQEN